MDIRRFTLLALALLAFPSAAHAGEGTPSVKVLSCSPWQEELGGTVTYETRMRAVKGTARMAVRIRLLERFDGERFHPVDAEGLNLWRRSRAGATGFRYEQHVKGLRQGATYRARVDFRWMGADGKKLRSARRTSTPCRQGGGPPNLRITGITVGQGQVEGTSTYNVTVVNRGSSEARKIAVLLRVDGEVVDESEVIETLGPGLSTTISFSGPLCRRKLRAVVDPNGTIAETREDDNVRTANCV